MRKLNDGGVTDTELIHYCSLILSEWGELRVGAVSYKLAEEYGITGPSIPRLSYILSRIPNVTRKPIQAKRENGGTYSTWIYGIATRIKNTTEVTVKFWVPTLNKNSSIAELSNKLRECNIWDFTVMP